MKQIMVVKHCGGGNVQFGITGQGTTVYMQKFQLCTSPFQDEKLGKGLRFHNLCVKDGKITGVRCTVCGFGHGIVRR